MKKSESIKNIAMALIKFNGEISKIAKDAENPYFKSHYATLDALIDATRSILQSHGLSILQFPLTKDDGSIGIQTLLLHESGEYIESEPVYMKPQRVNDPQNAGSIISYMRRYSYQAILNLNTGEDDDANAVSPVSQNPLPIPKTAKEAGALKITFGKNKGKTLKEIYKDDRAYFEWLTKNAADDTIRQGCQIIMNEMIKHKEETAPQTPSQPLPHISASMPDGFLNISDDYAFE